MKVSLSREAGFTLFEVTAALLLIAVLSALLFPGFAGMNSRLEEKVGLQQVIQDLKEMQSEAQGRKAETELILYPDKDYYSIKTDSFSLTRPLRGLQPVAEDTVTIRLEQVESEQKSFVLKGNSGSTYRIVIRPNQEPEVWRE
jgi:prepilin-type N-terminal cleavage/methylation domain-containing protein